MYRARALSLFSLRLVPIITHTHTNTHTHDDQEAPDVDSSETFKSDNGGAY
jgi:hypothetical protein